MICPADLCHQWCHRFIVLISLVKLLHAVEPTTIKAFDTGIGFSNICRNFINDFISKSEISAQRRKVFTNDAKVISALMLDRASISRVNGYNEEDGTIRLYFTQGLGKPINFSLDRVGHYSVFYFRQLPENHAGNGCFLERSMGG